jgi:hypothetical protein
MVFSFVWDVTVIIPRTEGRRKGGPFGALSLGSAAEEMPYLQAPESRER